MEITVTGLFVYPIKGCRGISLDEAVVESRGIAGDRRWMVIAEDGLFLTQRNRPGLATVEAIPDGDLLHLTAAGHGSTTVVERAGPRRTVRVWDDDVEAVDAGDDGAAFFSELLDGPCRLLRFPDDVHRQVDPQFAAEGDGVGFADGFPLLAISQASLDELNRRLEERGAAPVPMARFRPNLVVDGCPPHAEDGWARLTAGGLPFEVVKPCARCVVTTTDQRTGERRGPEPLATLATYRGGPGGVLFGQNLIPRSTGRVGRGDRCTTGP